MKQTTLVRAIAAIGAIVLWAALAPQSRAQEKAPSSSDALQRSKETLSLIDRARSLPPEFSADVMLKLAGSRLIPDPKWKRELLEDAYRAGAAAQQSYASVAYGVSTSALVSQLNANNGLDALTLQSRAATAMLALSPARAVAMFDDIVLPELPNESCHDVAVPVLNSYYIAAGAIFSQGFSAKQREKEEHLRFLDRRIASLRSSAQVDVLLRLILVWAQASTEERKRLLATCAVTLDRVSGSYRLFGASEAALVPYKIASLPEMTIFIPALRSYIVRYVSGPRCSEFMKGDKLPASVTHFNALVTRLDPGHAIFHPITDDEAKPSKDDGAFPEQKSWASPRAQQVLAGLRALTSRSGTPAKRWTAEERTSIEWGSRCADLLKSIEGWSESDEATPEEYLINVSQTYESLAELMPAGVARTAMMDRYLNFVETRYAETANRSLWFAQVRTLLLRAQYVADKDDRSWILDRLMRSSNPVISLYATLEKAVPTERPNAASGPGASQ